MAIVIIPRELSLFFNSNPEIQKFFEQLAFTTPSTQSENNTKTIGSDFTLTSSEGGITINASVNAVTISLPIPNLYKGKIYRIDVEDDTFGAYVYGNLNGAVQTFPMYVEESIIIQDNGSTYRTK